MKKQNVGFSLVELIVVIAIMSALAGIITPAYLSYLEKTRIQRDESAAGEIYRAAEIVVYTGTYDVENQVLVTFNANGIQIASALTNTQADTLLQEHFGGDYMNVKPCSKRYKNKTYTITILPPDEGKTIPKLSGCWN
ncbi:MAG: type II secretion system protein [Lachnospiraceae bacterium]|nr:type II secretion system protein [Lachnospiraceae bacterium]